MINRSYMANFFYWRFARGTTSVDGNYLEFRERAYNDPEIWAIHEAELSSMVDYTRENGIEFLVMLIPDLNRVEEASRYTDKVRSYLESRGVPVVDMGEHLAGRPWRELVVNSLDLHANVGVNREMAEALLSEMGGRGWVEDAASP